MNVRPFSTTTLLMAVLLAGCGTAGESPRGEAAAVRSPRVVSEGTAQNQTVPSAETGATPAFPADWNASPAGPLAPGAGRSNKRLRRQIPSGWPADVGTVTTPARGPGMLSLTPTGDASALLPFRAPAVIQSFTGLVDDNTVIPPDTMGAAGPNHLVSFLNSEVGFFTKTGTLLNPGTRLEDFWAPLITGNGLPNAPFDPKVLYNQESGRFIAVTLDGSLPATNSFVLLAVSRSSDPTAGWNTWAIRADGQGSTWADYPGLGVDAGNVYVTANMFDGGNNFRRSKIWMIPKSQLLQAPPVSTLTWTEFTTSGSTFTLQPAQTFGAAPAEYFLTEDGGGTLEVFAVTGSPPSLASIGTVVVDPYPRVSTLPLAPKSDIDTGDTRILNAVFRNGHLYGTHTVSDSTNTRTEAAWYEIAPSSPPTLVQQGRVSDPPRFYYYPSIAVNGNGDIALGFSGSSPTEFPGAYFAVRRSSDPPGWTSPAGLIKAGEGEYFKAYGGAFNRWGDYSATVVDPTDFLAGATGPFQVLLSWTQQSVNETFWTIQEYARPAAATASDNGQWGTWWGSFKASSLGSPGNPIAGFRVERKTGATGTYGAISGDLSAGDTSYADNAVTPKVTYFYRVQAFNAADNAYSPEVSVTTPSEVATPENLTAQLLEGLTVQLAWNDRATNEIGYLVERRAGAAAFVLLASLPADSNAFTDTTGLAPGTTYHYRVGAVGPYSTAYSAEVTVATPPPPGGGGGNGPGAGNGGSEGGSPAVSGGGGGGCLSVTPSPVGDPSASPAVSLVILFSPVTAYGLRKIFRSRHKYRSRRHPAC